MDNREDYIGHTVMVVDTVYAIVLEVLDKGFITTAGYVDEDFPAEVDCKSITYTSDHADCLPVEWADMLWLDDNDKRQRLKDILWDRPQGPVFRMEDGFISDSVTSLF